MKLNLHSLLVVRGRDPLLAFKEGAEMSRMTTATTFAFSLTLLLNACAPEATAEGADVSDVGTLAVANTPTAMVYKSPT